MNPVRGFPPSSRPDAVVLILGSMPGEASLKAGQYYAHPRNAFWPIMEAVLDIRRDLPYGERLAALAERRVALWDVLASCVRPGSLDSSILGSTAVPNDLPGFFRRHALIRTVFFNGAKAEEAWKRWVVSSLAESDLRLVRLPSTSPAHAGMSLQQKTEAWRAVAEATEMP
ncbi:DNA-deoxyinosine glycosylase [Aminivibrio sp.]|uniref:DNA-deoxyinosine glycosylase n=1 Tax=Aminivibrio sp. TaxID=1872489 RepID=UPI001A4C8FE3|nr:DNA-deoxyinosine glycosylase [Aminivibrio sp.]MBL3540384.1 DNA-deoxyinosine glycosylase [Aminivibrio sp.]MDK2958637.1 double-stranded uracil-DNA glycosylase [Synergistaceae bacterium]